MAETVVEPCALPLSVADLSAPAGAAGVSSPRPVSPAVLPADTVNARYVLGLDIGSVTAKLVLARADGTILATRYRRHAAAVRESLISMLGEVAALWPRVRVRAALTGSGALDLAGRLHLPFIQEVVAATRALAAIAPQTDVAVEIGGEDAKIMYLDRGLELRMNEVCAGGTGAFIDQMAALLNTDAAGLNRLAADAGAVYPIASRCGVFAKTDVVPLLNEGVAKSDIALSIFQAVARQTIGGLACGRPIRGRVAFAGGPLHFLTELKKSFISLLGLTPDEVVPIPDAQYLVALGAALEAETAAPVPELDLAALAAKLGVCAYHAGGDCMSLAPLFADAGAYARFQARHARALTPRRPLAEATGNVYLGVDLGSTTVKAALLAEDGALLASCYFRNEGDPLQSLLPELIRLLEALPPAARLRASAACGYGAQLAEAALGLDFTEVETVAHLKAARALAPDVSYVIDIGGQDMKCLKVEQGVLAGLTLNEACSAGCGAFLETFARSLDLDMATFVQLALFAGRPADLGSRCTVFMNSKVKNAQKQGAAVADIAAGLCYSIIRNALHKVLRIRDTMALGERVLVQGGTFLNDAVLRAMENLLGREVLRPDIAGLMGAYGAALIARERADGLTKDAACTPAALRALHRETGTLRCQGCENRCRLTVSRFSNGRRLVSGNRCERGAGMARGKPPSASLPPNLYAWKERRLFSYIPLAPEAAPRGALGLPRVLNMFEHYPFWFTLFTRLGYRVLLSAPTDQNTPLLGLDTIPSQTVCYPAKLAHGHVTALLRAGVKQLFYPCLPRESREHADADDCFNCPVVCGYPEVVRLNTDELRSAGAVLHTPFVQIAHSSSLIKALCREFDLPAREVRAAVQAARAELDAYRAELRRAGEQALARMRAEGLPGVVLGGRPYHVDPEIHHGLPDLLVSLGAAVLSEDSVAHLAAPARAERLRVVDQWTYHSRLYQAAEVVCRYPGLEMVQLISFGCGLDAITSDQVQEILERGGKWLTQIKIDEGASLGAARIRIRSLLAAMREKHGERATAASQPGGATARSTFVPRSVFTPAMRRTHTILAPQMAPLHFALVEAVMRGQGYRLQVLPTVSRQAIETGLDMVHSDACYPALVVIGQFISALRAADADPAHTALLLAQTCGQCRASNYPALLRKALAKAGFASVPILALSGGSLEKQPGFTVTSVLIHRLLLGCLYGDMLQRLSQCCRTYEHHAGDTDDVLAHWLRRAGQAAAQGDDSAFRQDMPRLVRDFCAIPQDADQRPRVGVVGEILLKYHPDANNHAAELIRQEGGEPVLTDLTDFLLYCCMDSVFDWRRLGGSGLKAAGNWLLIQRVEALRNAMRQALRAAPAGRFLPVSRIAALGNAAESIVSLGQRAGEGWLLTAEMLELIDNGISNVLCLQPFGCLPNHITGKGVFRELRRLRPQANIMGVDYDPGSSETNQLNRVKLFMSFAGKASGPARAPEAAEDREAAEGREDVWSVGCHYESGRRHCSIYMSYTDWPRI